MNWDVFISHASEDKNACVRDLAIELTRRGLKVWYDEMELKVGDSLRRKIDEGLANCDFGIVVLSPSFFGKNWPERELDGLATRDLGEKVILPIWHNVSAHDVEKYSLTLADKFAAKSSDGLMAVCDKIMEVVRPGAAAVVQLATAVTPEASGGDVHGDGAFTTVTPYTLKTLEAFAKKYNSSFEWEKFTRTVYASHRKLQLATIEQLAESVNDKPSESAVEALYQRLLGRSPDPLGLMIYTPWIFLLGEQGRSLVENSIMTSPEYKQRRMRTRIGIQSPPADFIPDPMTMSSILPTGWDADAWVKPDQSEYFLRAWNKSTRRSAIGQGKTFTEAKKNLINDVQNGTSRATVQVREMDL